MRISTSLKKVFSVPGKIAVPVYATKKDGIRYNQELIMHGLSAAIVYIGLLVLIPSLYASFKNNLTSVAIIDITVYILLLILCTVRSIPFRWRVNGVLVVFYFLGIGLIIIIGPYGAGFIWLFSFPILGGILLGLKSAVISSVANLFSVILLGIAIYCNWFSDFLFRDFDLEGWIAVSANFIGLSSFTAVTLGSLLNSLNKSIKKEQKTKNKLKKERDTMHYLKKKAEESDRLKTAFLSNVSHDIRTPMNAILGFTDLIRLKNAAPEKQEQYLDIIKKQGTILMNLINDIIDIAKIESDELSFNRKNVKLNEYLREVKEFFLGYMKAERLSGIELNLELYWDNEKSTVYIDENRLWQVLNNLITNALKFTDRGIVSFGYLPEDNNMLHFYVKDTGIGIKPESQKVIFNRFRQVEPENSRVYGGTGIGLSICKSIIEMQGGKIWVESEPGVGSEFHFILPYRE